MGKNLRILVVALCLGLLAYGYSYYRYRPLGSGEIWFSSFNNTITYDCFCQGYEVSPPEQRCSDLEFQDYENVTCYRLKSSCTETETVPVQPEQLRLDSDFLGHPAGLNSYSVTRRTVKYQLF